MYVFFEPESSRVSASLCVMFEIWREKAPPVDDGGTGRHVQGVAFLGEPGVAELLAGADLFGIYLPHPTGNGDAAALDCAIRVLGPSAAETSISAATASAKR